MAKMFWEKDANRGAGRQAHRGTRLRQPGSRARAQPARQQLRRPSGQRPGGPSWKLAETGWLEAPSAAEASKGADVIVMLTPDMTQPSVFTNEVGPNLKDGAMLLFSHGFNIHYGQIAPPKTIDVTMSLPRARRSRPPPVRSRPRRSLLLAIHQDATGHAFDRTLDTPAPSAARTPA